MRDWRAVLRERLAAEGLVPSAHTEAVDEIADHLVDLHRGAMARGDTETEADALIDAELARMGSLATAVAERGRRPAVARQSEGHGMAGLAFDFRHAVRILSLERGFSSIVIITLAIGIGGCAAVFSLVNALVLQPLPYPEPERLVMVWECDAKNPSRRFIVAKPVYEDWQREARTFESMGIWEYLNVNLSSTQEPEQVPAIRASASLFRALGVAPALGRVHTSEEDAPGHKVAVISDAVWRTHLGGQPTAIGKSLRLNGEPFEVIGVMPPGFTFPAAGTGVWVPAAFTQQDEERDSHSFFVAARVRPGVTLESARADIEQVGRSLQQRFKENASESSTITAMSDAGMDTVNAMLTALMGAVSLIFVIGCVNVANLQLGRALTRRREFVVRLSLGAGLSRLARQLFAESMTLALVGGVGGVVLAWMAVRTMDLVLTPGFRTLPYRGEVPITIDITVLLFAAAMALLSALLFGFAPLVGLRRREPHPLLKDGERGSNGAGQLARRVLVGVEVALAIIVMCAAGLLVKSLTELFRVNPGLDPSEVLTLQVSLPQADTYGAPVRETFCRDLSQSASGIPSLRSLGAISHLPFSGMSAGRGLTIEGREPEPNANPSAGYRVTCPGYFETLSIPVLEGRDFADTDSTRGVPVAIVNRAMAERYWPGTSPIGKRFKLGPLQSRQPWRTVIGVAENVRHFGLDSDVGREFYVPYAQSVWPVMTVVAKTVGEPMLQQSTLREVIRRVDPDLPIARVQKMEHVINLSVDWRETPMKLLTGFAAIGLLLASLGVYGVLAYYVSQRTREIGLRSALGATRSQLAGLVVRQSLLPQIAGVVVGIAGSIGSSRLLQSFLYQVSPSDPFVISIIVMTLIAVGLAASWLPARRAASIDPLVALRDE
jgi:putative ABC transport system permease protein